MAGFEDARKRIWPPDDDLNVDRGPHRFLGVPNWLILIGITLLAAVLRFSSLDKPSIWGDEAATWRRISGSFPETVQSLRTDGFMPTHYLLTWWIKEGFPYWGHFVEPSEESKQNRRDLDERMRRRGVEPVESNLPPETIFLDFEPTHRLIAGGIAPSPFVLRFIPALCGTIMVPAIYFLASQLVARRTALLAALFTACSAYALGYSRDAKMYMQFWCFATLHVACLFWWLAAYRGRPRAIAPAATDRDLFPKQRELGIGVAGVLPSHHVGHIARAFISDAELREPDAVVPPLPVVFVPVGRLPTFVRWACWVTAGLAMIAFNALGLAIVGLELLFVLLTEPQRLNVWLRLLKAIASPLLLIVDLIRGYRANVVSAAEELRSPYLPGATLSMPSAMPGRSSAAFLRTDDPIVPLTPSTVFGRFIARYVQVAIPPLLGFALGACAIVGLWHSYSETTRFYDRVIPPAADPAMQLDTRDAGINWVEEYNRGRTVGSLYLENAAAYLLNWEWVTPRQSDEVDPRALKYLTWTTSSLLIAIAAGVLPWRGALNRLRRNERVRDRVARERGPMPATAFLLLSAWLFLPTYGLYVAGGAWRVLPQSLSKQPAMMNPGDFEKVRAVTPLEALASIDRPVLQARYDDTRPADRRPLQGILANAVRPTWAGQRSWHDAWTELRAVPWPELFAVRPSSGASDPPRTGWVLAGLGIGTLLYLTSRWTTPARMLVIVTRALAAVIVLGGLLFVVYLAVPMQDESIWMPRYAGFVWPAFAIGVCVLIRRLPFAPLRCAVIVGLLGANLTQFVYRCRIGEPPTAELATSYLSVHDKPDARFFGSVIFKQFGGPGTGSVYTTPFVYYCALQANRKFTPGSVLGAGNDEFGGPRFDGNSLASGIRGTLARVPQVTQFDVWVEARPESPDDADSQSQRIAARLGGTWKLLEPPVRRMIYDHWTWRQLYWLEHERWQRTSPGTTLPSNVSATPERAPQRPARSTTRSTNNSQRVPR